MLNSTVILELTTSPSKNELLPPLKLELEMLLPILPSLFTSYVVIPLLVNINAFSAIVLSPLLTAMYTLWSSVKKAHPNAENSGKTS